MFDMDNFEKFEDLTYCNFIRMLREEKKGTKTKIITKPGFCIATDVINEYIKINSIMNINFMKISNIYPENIKKIIYKSKLLEIKDIRVSIKKRWASIAIKGLKFNYYIIDNDEHFNNYKLLKKEFKISLSSFITQLNQDKIKEFFIKPSKNNENILDEYNINAKILASIAAGKGKLIKLKINDFIIWSYCPKKILGNAKFIKGNTINANIRIQGELIL
jgi:hypothetical protein